jgi:hypothetical protein
MAFKFIEKLKRLDKQRRVRKEAKRLGLENYDDVESLFTDHYRNNVWTGGKGETVSGSGSTLKKTELLRDELPKLFGKHAVMTVFDAPCGDYNWFRHVERGPVRYIGGDIVKELVEQNNAKYADEITTFIHFDILKDKAPVADLWFCRDVLLHLSYDMIFEFLRNFARSEIPWLLVSTYHRYPENLDIPTGAGRPVNLQIAPFNFPPPEDYVEDDVAGSRPKRMGLWSRETIAGLVLDEDER